MVPVPFSDPIDVLVPPPRRFGSSVLRIVVTVVIVGVGIFLWESGLLRPNLGLDLSGSETQASASTKPTLFFIVRNGGRVSLSIEGVDARAVGLSDSRISFIPYRAGVGPGNPVRGPVSLTANGEVEIMMSFGSWDCRSIAIHGNDTVPIHVRSPLGVTSTVSVVPGFHFDPPGTPVLVGIPDANQIGWAAAITWETCHHGSGTIGSGPP
jgi:hypothetical protein